jgi:hypothetical protein
MWTLYAATYRHLSGEEIIDERVFESDDLDSLIRQARVFMDNRDGLFAFIPDPRNPELSLSLYATLIGADIEYGRDRTIKGHFTTWVRHDRVLVRPIYQFKRQMRYGDSE